jgi:hypothetical protein
VSMPAQRLIKLRFELLLLLLACLPSLAAQQPVPGTVYLAIGSDTAIWNAGTTVDAYSRYPYYSQSSFTDTNAPIFQVMDAAWRAQYKDSFGQPIKFTWWMMGGNIYRAARNLNVPLPNTMTLHLMKQYHGAAIRQFGDELSLHYHTFRWSDYNGNGVYYWNQTRTFEECRADFDVTLAQYLLEEDVFPVSFRSGWHFMDQSWQEYLNELLPYSFHNNYPVRLPWYTNSGPIAGIEDWSRAPSGFVPFHPSTNDYQAPGDGLGWNARSVKIQSLTQTMMDQMFAAAAGGTDQVACFWDHLPENFVANIARLASFLSQSSAKTLGVSFRYCTAVEAMQRWRGLTNEPPPQLQIALTNTPTLRLQITSSVPIFQARPFVCYRDVFQQYGNATASCLSTGPDTWSVDLGIPTNLLAKVAVAVTDLAGNLATQTIRFLPDDLYLDDSAPEYTEEQGSWFSTTNAAWGTTAAVMPLQSNTIAQASWSLPLANSGRYRFAVQVPPMTNLATNILFQIESAGTNVLAITMPGCIPTNQWVYLASVFLDQAVSNRVVMSVDGSMQNGALAVADVLRVVPVSESSLSQPSSANPVTFTASPLGYLMRWTAAPSVHYWVQRSASLESGWSTLEIVMAAANGDLEYLDTSPSSSQAFYRILAE